MKRQAITFDAAVEPGNALLLQVVGTLRELPSPPESFVWSYVGGTDEGRVWMVVSDDESKVQQLAMSLNQIPGITHVHCLDPEASAQLPLPKFPNP